MLRTNVVGTTGVGDRVLLLIHGYGADEYDLAPLAGVLDPTGRCFTVCPRGPIDLAPYGGAAWYDRSEDGVIEPGSFQRSVLALDQLLDAVCAERSSPVSKAIVVGFSQGGAMALALSLRDTTKARPAGVACLSGMLQTPEWFRYAWDADGWTPPGPPAGRGEARGAGAAFPAVCVQHGTLDPMVDIERGRRTRDVLASHGIAAEYREYPMHHEIRVESIVDLQGWLDRVVAADPY